MKKISLITSFYTVQFIHPSKRQTLFDKIFKSLNWGGAFIYFEKVRAPDARYCDIVSQIYQDYKSDEGYSAEEIISKIKKLKRCYGALYGKGNTDLFKKIDFKDFTTIMKFYVLKVGWL